MSTVSRRSLLLQRSNAVRAMRNPDLPDNLRALAKKAADHAEAALILQDAAKRKWLRPKQTSSGGR